jgi:hypothetical protein
VRNGFLSGALGGLSNAASTRFIGAYDAPQSTSETFKRVEEYTVLGGFLATESKGAVSHIGKVREKGL